MASRSCQPKSTQDKPNSIDSHEPLWEQFYGQNFQQQINAPFRTPRSIGEERFDDDSLNIEGDQERFTPRIPNSLRQIGNEETQEWACTDQEYLKIILDDTVEFENEKEILTRAFSHKGLTWSADEEKVLPSHFGLRAIHLQFKEKRRIHIQQLLLRTPIPCWLTLKKERSANFIAHSRKYQFQANEGFYYTLRYGALTSLQHFYYSSEHSIETPNISISFEIQTKRENEIQWHINNGDKRMKKALLLRNIDHSVIIDVNENGFDLYICQKCNINEFETLSKTNPRQSSTRWRSHSASDKKNNSHRQRGSMSRPPPIPTIENSNLSNHPSTGKTYFPSLDTGGYDRKSQIDHNNPLIRQGIQNGCYFPTIQFTFRVNPSCFKNSSNSHAHGTIKQVLSMFVETFRQNRITVCYANIIAQKGPSPSLFYEPYINRFTSLIAKYSWQILSVIGYRLQNQINDSFVAELIGPSQSPNPDELIYRVCVYLSRVLFMKPFTNINKELQHAIKVSREKNENAAFDLVRKIDDEIDNAAYIPSATVTPTTIRIKPLKLCRTNRVLRANGLFGKPLYNFLLVDIRDEDAQSLSPLHFGDLEKLILTYFTNGVPLMGVHRAYKYMHHSQSQLRQRQFWFYHHNDYDDNLNFRNINLEEAYRWMGNFDRERNPAKYAARVSLCFSTTTEIIEVPKHRIQLVNDILTPDGKFNFSDGCGNMSIQLRNQVQKSLSYRNQFSAVQFRYDGTKGVASLNPMMSNEYDLIIRRSMKKFDSDHTSFEVCKVSAPRPAYLNRQAILLLSYRKVPDASFILLQQKNHLELINCLLWNADAKQLILDNVPEWFLPQNIKEANIDYIQEPFFRFLIINLCLQSVSRLLRKTRIKLPKDKARNMFGIVDEYNVLKPNEVFIQYTKLDDESTMKRRNKTEILNGCQVVITKNPCHHPGDIRTFTAVDYAELRHLKDVVVFSQQGDRPACHDISGSDLDGDEYLVLWHEDLVPTTTENATPHDYDSGIPSKNLDRPITRDDINRVVLDIAKQDDIGKLSNLHLAFADRFGVDSNVRPSQGIVSTVELAGKISEEVDSPKTGYHPFKPHEIRELYNALGDKRPDFMENKNYESYESDHVLGKLFRASKKALRGWNKLVRYDRQLRHLYIQTLDDPLTEAEIEINLHESEKITVDESFVMGIDRIHPGYLECAVAMEKLVSVYRQELLEILNLYGLSHESDLWCRNSVNGLSGELDDTAFTELEHLVFRTRNRFFNEQVIYCETSKCEQYMRMGDLCHTCRKRQRAMVVACYYACYETQHDQHQMPILSLPWVFASALLVDRVNMPRIPYVCVLGNYMKTHIELLLKENRIHFESQLLKFEVIQDKCVGEANVDIVFCAFLELLQEYARIKNHMFWPTILSRFVRKTQKIKTLSTSANEMPSDDWILVVGKDGPQNAGAYAEALRNIDWNDQDVVLHGYFESILQVCFDATHERFESIYLEVSESIILLLQKMAIDETML